MSYALQHRMIFLLAPNPNIQYNEINAASWQTAECTYNLSEKSKSLWVVCGGEATAHNTNIVFG
jgi:hypothetical protein